MKNKLRKILSGLLVTGATVIPAAAHTYPETSSEYQLLKNVSTDIVRTGRESVVDKVRTGRESVVDKISIFEKTYASVVDTLRAIVIDVDNNGNPSEGDRVVFEENSEQPYEPNLSYTIMAPPNKNPSYRIRNGEVEVVPSIVHGALLNGVIMASNSDEFVKRVILGIERVTIKDSDSLLTRIGALYENGRH